MTVSRTKTRPVGRATCTASGTDVTHWVVVRAAHSQACTQGAVRVITANAFPEPAATADRVAAFPRFSAPWQDTQPNGPTNSRVGRPAGPRAATLAGCEGGACAPSTFGTKAKDAIA